MDSLLSLLLLDLPGGGGGILGIIHLVLFIVALVSILQSGMSAGKKVLWILVVLFLPVIGLILYFIFGR